MVARIRIPADYGVLGGWVGVLGNVKARLGSRRGRIFGGKRYKGRTCGARASYA
jgi:hypothetical protein